MRNQWFPQRVADYVVPAELKQLKAKDVSLERDFQFNTRNYLKAVKRAAREAKEGPIRAQEAAKAKARAAEIKQLTVSHTTNFLKLSMFAC